MSPLGWFLIFLCSSCSASWIPLIENFMKSQISSQLVIFNCKNLQENIRMNKDLFPKGLFIQLAGAPADNLKSDRLESLLSTDIYYLSVFLDLDCPRAMDLWSMATEIAPPLRPLGPLVHWLLFSNFNQLDFLESISGPRPGLDSNVFFVQAIDQELYDIMEIYRIGFGRPEFQRIKSASNWHPESKFPNLSNRNNLMGATVKLGIVNTEEDWSDWRNYQKRHINTDSKSTTAYTELMLIRLNLTKQEVLTNNYGINSNQKNRSFEGLMDLVKKEKIDIATGMVLKSELVPFWETTGVVMKISPKFILRDHPLSSSENIYILPFSKNLWLFSGLMLLLCTCLLHFAEKNNSDNGFLETLFSCLATLFDQGAEEDPERYSSRIIFFILLIQSVVLYNAYCACIVVILQTPNTKINNINALLQSSFRITMEDSEYNNRINKSSDLLGRRVLNKALEQHSGKNIFYSLKDGIELVQTEMVAFHSDVQAYKVISETFTEAEKCSLREIQMTVPWYLTLPLPKYSPLKELVTRNMIVLNQAGIGDKMYKYWHYAFPACFTNDGIFTSITLQDFQPVLIFYAIGLFSSLIFLLIEIVYYKIFGKRNLLRMNIFKKMIHLD